MKHPFRYPAFLKTRSLLSVGGLAMAIALAALSGLGGISACKAVDLASPVDTSTHKSDSAQISVTNDISTEPDSLILLLYSGNAVDVSNGALWTSKSPSGPGSSPTGI
jgi:hypothetical protein